jgi:hypothetical protein
LGCTTKLLNRIKKQNSSNLKDVRSLAELSRKNYLVEVVVVVVVDDVVVVVVELHSHRKTVSCCSQTGVKVIRLFFFVSAGG